MGKPRLKYLPHRSVFAEALPLYTPAYLPSTAKQNDVIFLGEVAKKSNFFSGPATKAWGGGGKKNLFNVRKKWP